MSFPGTVAILLTDALDSVTQSLASAQTRNDVLQFMLAEALQALGAVAGSVLLVEGHGLKVAAHQGLTDDPPSLWQASSLDDDTPAADALRRQTPLYFEHPGELLAAYPSLEARTGGVAAVATAVLPLHLQGQPLAVVVLEFREPHPFSPDEQRFFRILAVQGALALDRVTLLERHRMETLEQRGRAQALDAFVQLTEAVGLNTDLQFLIDRARDVLRLTLPDLDVDYFEFIHERWVSRFVPASVPDLLRPDLEAGLPPHTPAFARAVRQGGPLFINHWNADEQQVAHSEVYQMCAFAPYTQGGKPSGMLTSASQTTPTWTPEQQAVFTAVWRSLGGALDRSDQARKLERQDALDAFVAFAEQSTILTDVPALARQAVQVLRATLGEVSVAYYDLEDGVWRARVWSEDHAPDVVATLQAGIPVSAPSYAEAVGRREVHFVPGWDAGHEGVEGTDEYGAGAFCPYFTGGVPVGLLAMGTRRADDWSERERSVFRSVASSLGLALERAALTRELQARQAEVESRNTALEAFASLSRELALETDPYRLVRRAQEVTLSLLTPGYALYYERDRDRWRNRAQVGEVGHPDLQAFIDAGPPVGETPSVDLPWNTGQPFYQDVYAQGSDTPLEMVRHVGAAASLPVCRGGEVVGVFITVLFEQRTWTGADRVLLETAMRSLGLALDRSVQTQALEGERAGLDAFAAFTEAVGSETDVVRLARQAADTVNKALVGVSLGYYELEDSLWKARAWSEDVTSETVDQMRAGVPQDARNFAEAVHSRAPVFLAGWDAEANHLPRASVYGTAAFLPLFVAGEPRSLLAAGLAEARRWTEREQAILRAVARGLSLALERAEQSRQLQTQRDALDARTASLASANEELEAFAYSVSHDLRTPVRHVMGFADLARKALDRAQPETVTRHLEVIRQAGERMTALIDGMLMLSQVGQDVFRPRVVDLGCLVAQARRDVQEEVAGRTIRWHVGALPQVWGSPELLQQVMTNLLSNAVKYSAGQDVSEVTVQVETRDQEWMIVVRDNGVGFNPLYAGKLFGVFQRLHSEKEFGGTGVGLATVRRIVLKHGGRVFAESAPGAGATFSFTLPRPPGVSMQ